MAFRRLISKGLAIALMVVGVVLFPLPIPLGLPCMIAGSALWISANPTMARWLTVYRRRRPALDQKLRRLGAYLPALIQNALSLSDPRCAKARLLRRALRGQRKHKSPASISG